MGAPFETDGCGQERKGGQVMGSKHGARRLGEVADSLSARVRSCGSTRQHADMSQSLSTPKRSLFRTLDQTSTPPLPTAQKKHPGRFQPNSPPLLPWPDGLHRTWYIMYHWHPAATCHTMTEPLLSVMASLLPSGEKQQCSGWPSMAAVRDTWKWKSRRERRGITGVVDPIQ